MTLFINWCCGFSNYELLTYLIDWFLSAKICLCHFSIPVPNRSRNIRILPPTKMLFLIIASYSLTQQKFVFYFSTSRSILSIPKYSFVFFYSTKHDCLFFSFAAVAAALLLLWNDYSCGWWCQFILVPRSKSRRCLCYVCVMFMLCYVNVYVMLCCDANYTIAWCIHHN